MIEAVAVATLHRATARSGEWPAWFSECWRVHATWHGVGGFCSQRPLVPLGGTCPPPGVRPRARPQEIVNHHHQAWREFPWFHADLPGFGFTFFVCDAEFFSPAWAKKSAGAFFLPPHRFLARKTFFSEKPGFCAGLCAARAAFWGVTFFMPALSKKGNSRHTNRPRL